MRKRDAKKMEWRKRPLKRWEKTPNRGVKAIPKSQNERDRANQWEKKIWSWKINIEGENA